MNSVFCAAGGGARLPHVQGTGAHILPGGCGEVPGGDYTHAAGGTLTVVRPLEMYPDGLYQSTPIWTLAHPVGEYTHAPAEYREPAVTGTGTPGG